MSRTTFADLTTVHARLGVVDELLEQRRGLYRMAIELSAVNVPCSPVEVLDNPVVRAHVGAVLGGTTPFEPAELRALDELVAGSEFVAGHLVRLAGTAVAPVALGGVLDWLHAQLGARGAGAREPRLLTDGDPGFAVAWERLIGGVTVAWRTTPALVADVLPHVALFAALEQDSVRRLGSASARDHPGLVLLPEPDSALEAAEALIHEGAHQKFFDLAITRSLFGPGSGSAPAFRPSWSEAHWPVEQAFAACHAYYCLATFAEALRADPGSVPGGTSLLPLAAERASELGNWLVDHGSFLGTDGQLLIESLTGRAPDTPASVAAAPPSTAAQGTLVRRFGTRTLIGRRADPIELSWHHSIE